MGVVIMIMMFTYGLGFWYGSKLIEEKKINPVTDLPYTAGDVFTVFFSVLIGTFSTAQIGPCLKSFSGAKIAGKKAFDNIDRESKIAVNSNTGESIQDLKGDIEFGKV